MEALNFIRGVGSVAARYGLEEAVLLESMIFWWRTNRANNQNFHDGRWWTFNSVRAYTNIFPWWSEKQIRRILSSCVEQGALLEGCYNAEPRDRTKWYTPGDDLLELYGESETGNSDFPNGQMESPKREKLSAQMGEPLPCSTHEVQHEDPPYSPPKGDGARAKRSRQSRPMTAPDWKPERFAKFWAYYPRGENKQRAIRAWDKLRPSDELIDTMARALARQMASEDWQRGIGIPHASTWINGRRWEDEDKPLPSGRPAVPREPARVVEEEGTYLL